MTMTGKNFFIFVLILLAPALWAADYPTAKPEGFGTLEFPYLIASLENLAWISDHVDDLTPGTCFLQTGDIDAGPTAEWREGQGFPPIGDFYHKGTYFAGSYDGGGFSIENLGSNGYKGSNAGLFGCLSNAWIRNVNLENAIIRGNGTCGGLASLSMGSRISNCHVRVVFDLEAYSGTVGGLVALALYGGSICNSSVDISCGGGTMTFGGLFGEASSGLWLVMTNRLAITGCLTRGAIGSAGTMKTGGLAGCASNCDFKDCYSLADVSGSNCGGLIGEGFYVNLANCYAYGTVSDTGKAIIGSNFLKSSVCQSVYYCSEKASDTVGTGKTYEEMTSQKTYAGWNFEKVWKIEEGVSLPALAWEVPEPATLALLALLVVFCVRVRRNFC